MRVVVIGSREVTDYDKLRLVLARENDITLIVEHCDRVIAFWDGICEGTKYTMDYNGRLEKPIKNY